MGEDVYIGKLYVVIRGTPEKHDAKWLSTGDVVEVIGIYPRIILVQKVKPGGDGKWHMRQCYQRKCLHLNLAEL